MNPAKDRQRSRLALNVPGVFDAAGLVMITLANDENPKDRDPQP
ncbi:MAG TPA: hypothetical protein VFO43_05820 [Thiobacillus sp.]|nr:hypothetical protein [Thiobacillus sp.]